MFYHPLSKANLHNYQSYKVRYQPKIGMILQEADLVSPHQIKSALRVKKHYSHLLFGEILAMQGWLKPETADFFVEEWSNLLANRYRKPLGYYLQQAALLESEDIEVILEEQIRTGVRFGTVAVLQGFIKSTTLDFFLMNLFPQQFGDSPFINMRNPRIVQPKYSRARLPISPNCKDCSNYRRPTSEIDTNEPSKIIWIG